jgi:hypothetical protein
MSAVVIAGDTSGTVTLDAPAVAGTTVLTLPATSGTVLTQNPSAPADSLVVNASGNVGIGTSSPSARLDVSATSQADADGLIRAENTATTPSSATNASFIVKNYYGTSQFMQWENNGLRIGSRTLTNSGIGNIVFSCGSDVESMRLNSNGRMIMASQSGSSGAGTVSSGNNTSMTNTPHNASIWGYNTSSDPFPIGATAISATQGMIGLFNSGGTVIGSVSRTGASTVAYNTSSDYRLKENIAPMTGALDTVAQLKPVTYNWKEDGSDGQGFIAHELAEVVPDCVSGQKDAVDADGNPLYQGIDTSFLVATLTAAIQELNAKVEAQAEQIKALQGAA